MTNLFHSTLLLLLFFTTQTAAQTENSLQREIERIVATKKAAVGVSIVGDDGKNVLSLNADKRFPLQSVFKLHIALVVLAEIDKGKLSLDQKIVIEKKDLLPGLYSPLREKYPEGASLPLSEILQYTVSESDNVGCDVLLRLLGGPPTVEAYFVKNKFEDVSIKLNEETQQSDWELQFRNWTTPKAATRVLSTFFDNEKKLLSPESHAFLWKAMTDTKTGANRLKAGLPPGTVVAHKTGSSGTNRTTGVTAAVNDIGIVFLPNGRHFFISVLVTDSKEDAATNEKIIADVSKAAWNHFTRGKK